MQPGDSVLDPQLMWAFLFGVSGVASNGATPGNFSALSSDQVLRSLGNYTDPLIDLSHVGSNIGGPNAPAGNFSLIYNMGYQGFPPGSTNAIASRGGTLPPTNADAWWVGTVGIRIDPGTLPGGTLDLCFHVGQSTPIQVSPYSPDDQTSRATTVAYGWDAAAGAPDFHRYGSSAFVNGRDNVHQMFSSSPDARINIVPEPGTAAFLTLFLLARRRRR